VLLQTAVGLVESLAVEGARTRAPGPEAYSPDDQVSFPYHGLCVWHVGRDDVTADANCVKFITGGEGFRVSRPLDDGHAELLVTSPRGIFAEILDIRDGNLPHHGLFRRRSRPSDTPTQLLAMEGLSVLPHRTWSTLAAEEWVLTLLRRALLAPGAPVEPSPATRRTLARAKEYLASRFSSNISGAEVARAAGVSPLYLSSLFTRFEAAPLHRYLVRLRLARALVELPYTADLAALANELGFTHHSHFSAAFRRAFGITPSAFRTMTRRDAASVARTLRMDS
jgi:AraC family transcriptional regulator